VLHLLEDRLAKNGQVIYSTHSPFLIPASDLHRLRLVVKLADEGSVVINRLTDPRIRGEGFSDTLSPILTAIGIDIREALRFTKEKNVIAEGISDYFYVHAWARLLGDDLTSVYGVFPSMGAMSTTTLASLFIGWGLDFVVLLDRDDLGNAARQKLIKELGLSEELVVQPDHAAGIEDLFSAEDFKNVIKHYDQQLTIQPGETPTRFIKRVGVDKVLLARKYSELSRTEGHNLTAKTKEMILKLFAKLKQPLAD
jgi:predicted ATP-dependent endonuclease of OLD family